MKNILKISSLLLLLIIGACTTNDKEPIVSANGLLLNQPATGTNYILTPQTAANDLFTLTWNKSDNGIASTPTYTIQVAKSGTDFANPIEVIASTDILVGETYTVKAGFFNGLLNQIGFTPCGSLNVDVRIKSTLGIVSDNAFIQYSNPVTLQVTPYSLDLPLIAFSASNAISESTPKLAASGILNTDYQGYMYLTPGTYKFYKPNNSCNLFDSTLVYGDDNTASGTLIQDGNGYLVVTAGYYLVSANLTASGPMSYSVRPTTWNLIGSAKTFAPLGNTALTYDQAANVWTGTNLTLGEGFGIKFRSNGSGSNVFVLGQFIPSTVNTPNYAGMQLSYMGNPLNAADLALNELVIPGIKTPRVNHSYNVVLDLSKPRNYTYTITLNP